MKEKSMWWARVTPQLIAAKKPERKSKVLEQREEITRGKML